MTQPLPHCGGCGHVFTHHDTTSPGFLDEVIRHTCADLDIHAHTAITIANQ